MSALHGVLRGVDEDEVCVECGCKALDHTPCCGCCTVCGNRRCPEFDAPGWPSRSALSGRGGVP